jgi:hypothetical protein
MEEKVLITKCRKCENIVSGTIVNCKIDTTPDWHYTYHIYEIDSEENKRGFKIKGCVCQVD